MASPELFFPDDWPQWPDYKLGSFSLDIFIMSKAEASDLPVDPVPDEFAKRVQQWLLTTETDTAEHPALEMALRRAAAGEFEIAGKILRKYITTGAINRAALDEVATGRRRQRSNARKPRTNALQALILEIVEGNPGIKPRELVDVLRNYDSDGVIEEITEDDVFYIQNGVGGKSAPISGLKDRISRARKSLGKK